MYLNKLNDPLCCLVTFPKMCCSVQFWRSFPKQNNQTCEKNLRFHWYHHYTILLEEKVYMEFFSNYPTLKAKVQVEIMRKHAAALEDRWLARGLTALQVVRTSFLGPRPHRLPPPLPPPWVESSFRLGSDDQSQNKADHPPLPLASCVSTRDKCEMRRRALWGVLWPRLPRKRNRRWQTDCRNKS